MNYLKISTLVISILLFSCSEKKEVQVTISSPDNNVEVAFNLNENGTPTYKVSYKNEAVIKPSTLGFEIKNQPKLSQNFEITNSEISSFEETWEMPWGEQLLVENKYNQLKIELQETSALKRKLTIIFKVSPDISRIGAITVFTKPV